MHAIIVANARSRAISGTTVMRGKYILGASLIFTFSTAVSVLADKPAPPSTNAPTAAAAPAPPSPAQLAWNKIKTDFTSLQSSQDEEQAKKLMPTLAGETKDFFTKFPDDVHALNATMLWAQLGQEMDAHNIAGGPAQDEIDQTFEKLATDPKVPKPKRAEIRAMQIGQSLQKAAGSDDAAAPGMIPRSASLLLKRNSAPTSPSMASSRSSRRCAGRSCRRSRRVPIPRDTTRW